MNDTSDYLWAQDWPSEPNYDDAIAELESLEASMANVGSYDDWFIDLLEV